MVMPREVKFFIVAMGFLFIIVGIAVSLATNFPDIIPMGMGIVGIFLLILPYTYVREK